MALPWLRALPLKRALLRLRALRLLRAQHFLHLLHFLGPLLVARLDATQLLVIITAHRFGHVKIVGQAEITR